MTSVIRSFIEHKKYFEIDDEIQQNHFFYIVKLTASVAELLCMVETGVCTATRMSLVSPSSTVRVKSAQ